MFHLSQGLLDLLSICPRKFQHLYLDQLSSPTAPDQQERIDWGNRFHVLMQQRELGLLNEPDNPNAEEILLYQAIEALLQADPELFQADPAALRQSEHHRSLELNGYLLTASYDLLILKEQQAQILDWKTYPRPHSSRKLAQHWQTRLYPFLLAETSNYLPEQIFMTYWFVWAKPEEAPLPQSLTFTYSRAQHQQILQDLDYLLHQLTEYLKRYRTDSEPFPQVTSTHGCESCSFALRCQRGSLSQGDRPAAAAALEEIQEIKL